MGVRERRRGGMTRDSQDRNRDVLGRDSVESIDNEFFEQSRPGS